MQSLVPDRWRVLALVLFMSVPMFGRGASPSVRETAVAVAPAARAGFTRMDAAVTGLAFTNLIAESRHLTNQVLLNGSGIAAGDVDGDGRTDVFLCGFDNANALYRNLGGWRFEEGAEAAGLAMPGVDCTGAAMADLDGDGDLDLVVNTLGQGTWILVNDGKGRFQRRELLNEGAAGMTCALADVDGDGFLDLYITNYRMRALMDMPNTRMTFRKLADGRVVVDTVNGRPASDPEFLERFLVNEAGGIEEQGEPDRFYRNAGGTNFVEVPWTGGMFLDEAGKPLSSPPRDWGLAAMFHDVNGDGRPDLYVCNDFQTPDRFWLNRGEGRLQLAPALALRRTSLSSMAVDFADVNRDGLVDFFVADMLSRDHGMRMRWVRDNFPHRPVVGRYEDRPQYEQNMLQVGMGEERWSERAQMAGVVATEWTWACAFVDVDLDGWEDLLTVNGMQRAGRDLDVAERLKAARTGRALSVDQIFQGRRMFPRLATPNLAFRNRGDLTFTDVSRDWGFDLPGVSQCLALADLDHDGDIDVLVGNLNEAVAVYRNEAVAPRLAVRLAGGGPNTRGIGARIEVHGGPVAQSQEVLAGGRYLSGDDPVRSFAAGQTNRVRVRWPGGAVSEVAGIAPNRLVEIPEPESGAALATEAAAVAPKPWFEDVTSLLAHRHPEEASNDFARQALLPWKLSQPGPGVAWLDLDGDGKDDLLVGAGRGGRIAAFRNGGNGTFAPLSGPSGEPLGRDVTGMVGPVFDTAIGVIAALASYEDASGFGPAVAQWSPAGGGWKDLAPVWDASAGPLALADVDGDGDLDLFVGGRVIPGAWPSPASSRIYLQDRGRWRADAARNKALASIGLVSGALFSDLDQDGDADLVLACEWGPVRVLLNEPTGLVDATARLGLDRAKGWWNSVAAGDFDGDGRMDLIAGNWGRNTPWEEAVRDGMGRGSGEDVLRVYHGDLGNAGAHDVVEAMWNAARGAFVPVQQRTLLSEGLPQLMARFPSHAAFGEASVDEVLGPARTTANMEGVSILDTCLLLNRGDRFEIRPLPHEAQVAPVFGIAAGDFNGDGAVDVFLAQNFFAVRPYTPRLDGGSGVVLIGDGRGGFAAMSPNASGIRIPGEQRGAAAADYDQDGRLDLVVGQNGAETRLFRNREARPGLRVRFGGSGANPTAIGARVRWKAERAPVHEVRAGGGYLSQDSPVLILGRVPGAGELEVAWPGDRVFQRYPVGEGATEVTVRGPAGEAPGSPR